MLFSLRKLFLSIFIQNSTKSMKVRKFSLLTALVCSAFAFILFRAVQTKCVQ